MLRVKIQRKRKVATRPLLGWIGIGVALLGIGFAMDGVTEAGHHGLLIVGAMMIGFGARGEDENDC